MNKFKIKIFVIFNFFYLNIVANIKIIKLIFFSVLNTQLNKNIKTHYCFFIS